MSQRRLAALLASTSVLLVALGTALVPAGSAAVATATRIAVNPYAGDAAGVPLRLYVAVHSSDGYPTGTISVTDDHDVVRASGVALSEHAVAVFEFPAGPDDVTQYTVDFRGTNGYADSTTTFTHYLTVDPRLDADSIVKVTTPQSHALWMGATLTNGNGTPLVNRVLRFSLGAPYGADGKLLKGGLAFCATYTLDSGYGECMGEVLGQALLALLTGAYVSYVVPGHPELYRSAKIPLIAAG